MCCCRLMCSLDIFAGKSRKIRGESSILQHSNIQTNKMFVPRAVKHKPATKPVKSRPQAKAEYPANTAGQTQRDQESDSVPTDSQGGAGQESAGSHVLRRDAPETTAPFISEKGAQKLTEDNTKNEIVLFCQNTGNGSESPLLVLEGTSKEPENRTSSTSSGATSLETDTACLQQADETCTTDSVTEAEKVKLKEDRKGETDIGVRSGISSHLLLDIAEIRRSVDRIKRGGGLKAVCKDTGDDVTEDATDTEDEKDETEDSDCEDHNQEVTEEGQEEVVSYSKNQRWPVSDEEPVCVMCGRYGAYICDQTEADVCSRECKARNLARLGLTAGLLAAPGEDSQPEMSPADTPMEEEPIGYIYKEHDEVSDLTKEQVQEIRAQVELFVEGVDVPRPIIEFSHLGAPKKMGSNLASVGYNTPTPVQMQVIPAALRWRDMMVCAQTSSGKTAAFLVPTILQIFNIMCFRDSTDEKGPLGLILSPSRELAMQIEEQAKELMQGLPNMRTALVVGGVPLPTQLHRLKQDIQLVIATPGRILDVLGRDGVSLAAIKVVVIDEVDTMLHKGFQQQVIEVIDHLPESHQTMLFSATIPPSIEKMATSLLRSPLYISVGKPNTPCTSVRQIVMWVEEPAKKKNLFAILQDPKHYRPPLVVFVDSKIGAGLLSLAIHKMCDIHAVSLHGDRPQSERTETLRGFREGEYPVLVCTAVLGRGIDLPGVKMVVNFDMPTSVEEYIHQIGRTGRLGSRGTAITFINNGSKNLFLEFVNTLRPLGVPLPPQLTNSTHLRYQQLGHQSWKEARQRRKERKDEEHHVAGRYGNASYFSYKRRKQEASAVGELLRKRKHKKGPR
ncbi:probable ATP-dependent RNA helicase DDX59 isoform X2 [Acanthaster planci]|uniref:RNA helicase n=1 Tax=Acanthaster planci TaxID=133434 RepID=A0A8B7YSA9_ACAPL|nr:probable ATP-dependent RNA helicase DDX59 isoform X2 [Acanthaster planci]